MTDALVALWAGAAQVLSAGGILFLLVGVAIGYVVGLVPGIGGPAAMALLLPSVFSLDVVPACALLTGLAASTVTAGEVTSILLGVPGEATSAAMVADGHRLTVRGEGGRAAAAAVTASFAGGAFGAAVLACAIPIARPLLSHVASPELLVLALMSILLVSPISTEAPIKGVAAGAAGLALATIGLDPSDGVPRFTFGRLFLSDGIGLMPVALGLFAVPEAVRLLHDRAASVTGLRSTTGAAAGVRDALRRWRLVLRCSAIGTTIGLLPGVGATVSQWLAYGHAAQSSVHRRRFGTGEIEGVIGPGAASNATLGGDMVPTLALGVPGSLPTAILLGALVLKGITPGPSLLLPASAGGQLPLVFSFVWMILIGNAIAAIISLLFLDRLSAIARIRPALLFPVVMTFVPLGVYAERQASGDLIVAGIMSIVGCVMARYGWPRAPLLLGLVLGPLIERRGLLAIAAYGWTWLWRPGVLLLTGAAVVLFRQVRRRPDSGDDREAIDRPVEAGDGLVALAAGAIASSALAATASFSGAPAIAPRIALVTVAVLSLAQAVMLWRRRAWRPRWPFEIPRQPVAAFASAAPFALGPLAAGFALNTAIASALYLRLGAREPWSRVLGVSLALALVVALVERYAMPGAVLGGLR